MTTPPDDKPKQPPSRIRMNARPDPTTRQKVDDLHAIERRLAPSCERIEPRPRTLASGRGLRRPAERKTSWQLAEGSGDATPSAFQQVLRRALWNPEAVREALRPDVRPHLGDSEAVLGLDDTGFLNKGRPSAGVDRQDRGTAGRRG